MRHRVRRPEPGANETKETRVSYDKHTTRVTWRQKRPADLFRVARLQRQEYPKQNIRLAPHRRDSAPFTESRERDCRLALKSKRFGQRPTGCRVGADREAQPGYHDPKAQVEYQDQAQTGD